MTYGHTSSPDRTRRKTDLKEPKEPKKLSDHWAIAAIDASEHERARRLVDRELTRQALGKQIHLSSEEESLLGLTALAFELAAIEGLDELTHPSAGKRRTPLRDQTVAAASRTFERRRLLPTPNEPIDRLLFMLEISAIAYCGDRRTDLRQWYREHETRLERLEKLEKPEPDITNATWEHRLLYQLSDCWIRLFRKDGYDDPEQILKIVASLRNEQDAHEKHCFQDFQNFQSFQSNSKATNRATALRLAALYDWAKATETLATCILRKMQKRTDRPLGMPDGTLDKHFKAGIQAASASGDTRYAVILRWLHATAHLMIAE